MTSVFNSINRYLFTTAEENHDSKPHKIHEININNDIILISNTKIPPAPPIFPIDLYKKSDSHIKYKTKYKNFNDYRKELKKKEKRKNNKQNYRKKSKKR